MKFYFILLACFDYAIEQKIFYLFQPGIEPRSLDLGSKSVFIYT